MALRTAMTDHATAVPSWIVPLDLLLDPDGLAAGEVPEATGGSPAVLFGATLPVVWKPKSVSTRPWHSHKTWATHVIGADKEECGREERKVIPMDRVDKVCDVKVCTVRGIETGGWGHTS